MIDPKALVKASCKEICQELAKQEKAWLDKFYDQTHRGIKEKETVELVQHAIGLPLQAQERMQKFFTEQGVAYVNTAWRELSAQLPKLDYEYVNWSLPSTNHMDSSVPHESDEKRTIRLPIPAISMTVSLGMQRQKTEDDEKKRKVELRRRIKDVKGRNKNRVDCWCAELEKLTISALEKHLSL